MKKFNHTKWLIESKHNESMFSKGDEFEEDEVELPGLSEKSLKQKIQELSLDQKAKLYFMGLVRQGKIDTLPEDPKAAYVSMMMDKDDYGRSVSGKDKRTFMEPEDMTTAARARKMAGIKEETNWYNIALDIAGLFPFVGEPADFANTVDYAIKGDYLMSALSAVSMIPEVGDVVGKGGKLVVGTLKTSAKMTKRVILVLRENKDTIDKLFDTLERKSPDKFKPHIPKMKDALNKFATAGADVSDALSENQLKEIAGMMEDKKPNLKSMADVDRSSWTPDGGGGSIGYMEYEDGTEMTPQEIQDYFEVNHELYDDIMQGLYETNDPEDEENERNLALDDIPDSLREMVTELGYLNESKVDISYTDPGFRFYKMKVNGKRLNREEGTKYLKDLGIVDDEGKDMEIPRNYDQSILDDIVKALKEKGIDADHDAAMDVS